MDIIWHLHCHQDTWAINYLAIVSGVLFRFASCTKTGELTSVIFILCHALNEKKGSRFTCPLVTGSPGVIVN